LNSLPARCSVLAAGHLTYTIRGWSIGSNCCNPYLPGVACGHARGSLLNSHPARCGVLGVSRLTYTRRGWPIGSNCFMPISAGRSKRAGCGSANRPIHGCQTKGQLTQGSLTAVWAPRHLLFTALHHPPQHPARAGRWRHVMGAQHMTNAGGAHYHHYKTKLDRFRPGL